DEAIVPVVYHETLRHAVNRVAQQRLSLYGTVLRFLKFRRCLNFDGDVAPRALVTQESSRFVENRITARAHIPAFAIRLDPLPTEIPERPPVGEGGLVHFPSLRIHGGIAQIPSSLTYV